MGRLLLLLLLEGPERPRLLTAAHTAREALLLTEYEVRTNRPTQAAEPAVWVIMSV
jgi:hypothetical protein